MKEPSFIPGKFRGFLKAALREDGAWEDRTTKAVLSRKDMALGELEAKESGVLAGLALFTETFRILDRGCRIFPVKKDGAWVKPGQTVAKLSGPAWALLAGERTALNLLSRLSGVASLTRRFVEAAGRPVVYDTRKTTPLFRELERYAVRVGGGKNHRFNLASAVLIKDNHLALGGGVYRTVRAARRKYGRKEILQVEVENPSQALTALVAGADILLVDNNSPAQLRKIAALVGKRAVLEASGGMGLSNIRAYARTGVRRISVGALTHSAPALDFSLTLSPTTKKKPS